LAIITSPVVPVNRGGGRLAAPIIEITVFKLLPVGRADFGLTRFSKIW